MENTQNSETKKTVEFPLIGTRAPEFVAQTTHGEIHFPNDYEGRWVILFSHPADFTPVCTTEFITFASRFDEYQALNTDLVGLSIDSVTSHMGWVDSIKTLEWEDHKNVEIPFPIIDDITRNVASKYGMLQGESDTATVRAVFFVDPQGIIRTILYYPASLGRNFDEIHRILIGLQKADKDKVALPADWKPGKDVILPPPKKMEDVAPRLALDGKDGHKVKSWYLTFKEDKEG